MPRLLRGIHLVIAAIATTAPIAHVLELPNKLRLDGPLWLAVQQQIYRGWGAVFGPVEILALLTTFALVFTRKGNKPAQRPTVVATGAYAAMLAVFFIFNAPVNAAVASWTSATMPADWADYRGRWEFGHALAAALSVLVLVALVRASSKETV
jgi:hypothetical protein